MLVISQILTSTSDSGGSLVAALLSQDSPVAKNNLFAAVRADEQVDILKPLGITALQVDLLDEQAVAEAVLQHESITTHPLPVLFIKTQGTDVKCFLS